MKHKKNCSIPNLDKSARGRLVFIDEPPGL
jgi:hypothetical protein